MPDGKAKGKVIVCRLHADGETGLRYGEVTIACSVGENLPKGQTMPQSTTVFQDDYCHDGYQYCHNAFMISASGISYYRYDDQKPEEGISNLKILHAGNIVQNIEVENHSLLQEEYLKNENPSTLKKATQLLNQHSTNIRIHLRDLRTQEKIEHTLILKPHSPWSSPKQIFFHQ